MACADDRVARQPVALMRESPALCKPNCSSRHRKAQTKENACETKAMKWSVTPSQASRKQ